MGLFTAEPGHDGFDAKHVVRTERRVMAGIDPYNYYIDRNSGDNVLRLADR